MTSILRANPASITDSLHSSTQGNVSAKRRVISVDGASGKALESRKLRASCDCCYLAKIKCGKERPRCSRCVTHDTACVYSPSQRIGKPRRHPPVSLTSPSRQQCSPGLSTSSLSLNDGREDLVPDAVNLSSNEWPFHLTPPTSEASGESSLLTPGLVFQWQQAVHGPSPQTRLNAFDNGEQQPNTHPFDQSWPSQKNRPSSQQPSTFNLQHPWAQQSSFQLPPEDRPLTHPSTDPSLLTPSTTTISTSTSSADTQTPAPTTTIPRLPSHALNTTPSPPNLPNTLSELTCTCTTTILDILHSLHARPPSTPFDAILAANKSILARLSTLLTCSVCSCVAMDAALVMTLAAALLKMVTWYATAATEATTSLPVPVDHAAAAQGRPSVSTGHSNGNADAEDGEAVREAKDGQTVPINTTAGAGAEGVGGGSGGHFALGAYTLEASDEVVIKKHVVLSDLRKVDALIVGFGGRFRGSGNGASGPFPNEGGCRCGGGDDDGGDGLKDTCGTGAGGGGGKAVAKRKRDAAKINAVNDGGGDWDGEEGDEDEHEHRTEGEKGMKLGQEGGGANAIIEAQFYPDLVVFLRRKLREVVRRLQRDVRVEFAELE